MLLLGVQYSHCNKNWWGKDMHEMVTPFIKQEKLQEAIMNTTDGSKVQHYANNIEIIASNLCICSTIHPIPCNSGNSKSRLSHWVLIATLKKITITTKLKSKATLTRRERNRIKFPDEIKEHTLLWIANIVEGERVLECLTSHLVQHQRRLSDKCSCQGRTSSTLSCSLVQWPHQNKKVLSAKHFKNRLTTSCNVLFR